MKVFYLLITSILIISCRNSPYEKSFTAIQNSKNSEESKNYFLICTDPIAYSFHKDYSSSRKYCNGLKYCIHIGYDVIRLSEIEAKSKFGIAQTGLQILIKRFEVPKLNVGLYAYVPKTVSDKLMS